MRGKTSGGLNLFILTDAEVLARTKSWELQTASGWQARVNTYTELSSEDKMGDYWLSWRRKWWPTPILLPGKSHGRRSLVGYSPWGRNKLETTEQLHFHFSLSCIGEGNGNPLQYSCLENPRDKGTWWAAVYGVAKSQTRLKRLSSSSIIDSGLSRVPWTARRSN